MSSEQNTFAFGTETLHQSHPSNEQFLSEVLAGLSLPEKALPCKYLYDAEGSALFDQICDLPEYYLTRTEAGIMRRNAGEIAQQLGSKPVVVELGSGSSTKTRILLDSLSDAVAYLPVDISHQHLLQTAAGLREEYPDLSVEPIVADFLEPFQLDPRYSDENVTVFFPGSTIGNLTPEEAHCLLQQVADMRDTQETACRPKLLIGFDLVKEAPALEAAYNDSAGVSAAFSLNLLTRMNRELEANFQVEHFEHYAYFNAADSRIEIYITSLREQSVTIAGREIQFAAGERIHTEYSHKYTRGGFEQLAANTGFSVQHCWTDAEQMFALMLLSPRS